MGSESGMAAALDMVTVAPARILGRQDHGLAVGCRADLVVLDASTVAEAVGGFPARALVVKDGRITARAAAVASPAARLTLLARRRRVRPHPQLPSSPLRSQSMGPNSLVVSDEMGRKIAAYLVANTMKPAR
jgi:cytosine deaminase